MSNPDFSIRVDKHVTDLSADGDITIAGNSHIGGNLSVAGSISPGTFTNRVVTLVAPTAPPTSANVTVLTASQSGTTFILPTSAVVADDWHIVLPAYELGLKFKFVISGAVGGNEIRIYPNGYVAGATAGASGLPTSVTAGTIYANVYDTGSDTNVRLASAAGGGLGNLAGGFMFQQMAAQGPDNLELECILGTQGADANHANWQGRANTNSATALVVSA